MEGIRRHTFSFAKRGCSLSFAFTRTLATGRRGRPYPGVFTGFSSLEDSAGPPGNNSVIVQ